MANPWQSDTYDFAFDLGSSDRLLTLAQGTGHLSHAEVEDALAGQPGTAQSRRQAEHPSLEMIEKTERHLQLLERLHTAKLEAAHQENSSRFARLLSPEALEGMQGKVDSLSEHLSMLVSRKDAIRTKLAKQPSNFIDLPVHLHQAMIDLAKSILRDLHHFRQTLAQVQAAMSFPVSDTVKVA
ncbi:hypothetical protein PTSG_11873 [Salpingoeca rosetta]|uniref:Uncharacterized protein n=1 Tax=Salpingoeca rosetta (strain ATCC 50818 / BSB-021) TaxID=946362 RepID=F2U202_SALR5|nr:uncharacterized protein PTSG_11873 [Salpingoeca rosetta]EGD81654.1 hypothetical protein PTSG_11873 [Salpingoeca rosetta]|eukprot:XP_004996858.1 hypothetical protein PTSG_11873 [Salpingoeca rosetta]